MKQACQQQRSGFSVWTAPILLMAATFIGNLWLAMAPTPNRPVAAFFPPWWDASKSIAAVAMAGGDVIRSGAWPAIIVGLSSDAHFIARLHAQGAWLVLDPQGLGICGAQTQNISDWAAEKRKG